jgi:hypothetical protein
MTRPSPADPEVVADPLVARRDLEDGLRFLHLQATQSTRDLFDLTTRVMALTEELVASGEVDLRAMDERRERVRSRERKRLLSLPLVVVDDTPDKYALPDLPEIDCDARLHLCKARCCSFTFSLSFQDLNERVVQWDYARPYQIRQNADGYCAHNVAPSRSCGIYAQRPAVCRRYDCRQDKRIWSDFENRLPAPEAPPSPDGAEVTPADPR